MVENMTDKQLPAREKIRYYLYNKRYSETDDAIQAIENEESQNVIEYFSSLDDLKLYGGWSQFAIKWDIELIDEKWQIVARKISEDKEWDSVLYYRAEIYPNLQKSSKYKTILK